MLLSRGWRRAGRTRPTGGLPGGLQFAICPAWASLKNMYIDASIIVRDASEADLVGITAIYNDVVATTTAIYSGTPATLADRRAWLTARVSAGFPVLVAVRAEEEVCGFASFGAWRGAWPGYRYTVEHSVHVAADWRGAGVGRQLMSALIARGQAMGLHAMIGAVDAANAASLGFHEKLGFQRVALMPEVGRKFDRWLDLVFVHRFLDAPGSARQVERAITSPPG